MSMSVVVPFNVKMFINQEVTRQVQGKIVSLVQQSYKLVDSCLDDVSFLQWTLGRMHIGHLDHIAVQFSLYEAAKKGILENITAQIVPNAKKTAYHVELKTNNTIITINRADSKEKTARKAVYRTILQRDNQIYWNFDNDEILEEPGYLQLTHNHINRVVNFVNLGVPNGKGKWYSKIDLTKKLQLLDSPFIQEKNEITKEQLVRFKKFAQGVNDNGGKN